MARVEEMYIPAKNSLKHFVVTSESFRVMLQLFTIVEIGELDYLFVNKVNGFHQEKSKIKTLNQSISFDFILQKQKCVVSYSHTPVHAFIAIR